ncbi:hypothetical protein [Cellulomonas dongxiuzhuiae]|uniref:hypothetical protein n=1 Tax=Cellulomonas dongxiuzhuiae TaxID=2819979 RepID=UPI001AAF52F7|nr:hypothetical protein [Cellulomonas dongxiuzhuiae]MBO3087569.1 hypothetical protein [Cellulomonas dongxiuzhuiae]
MTDTVTLSTPLGRTTTAGIPTLWCDLPGDYTAALVVGLGARDLTPRTAGLHHLVEHVVMSRVGHVTVEHNAASGPDSMSFWATGDPPRVHDFLHRVAAVATSLHDITDADLRVDRATVLAEVGLSGLYAGIGPLAARWGAAGLGLADLGHAPLLALDASDVRGFAARAFVTGACRLALTRPPLADLDPQLPVGLPVRGEHPPALALPTPGIAYTDDAQVTVSFLVGLPPEHRHLVGSVIRETLLRRLRRASGSVYGVDIATFQVDATTSSWTFTSDPPTPAVARDVLRETVRALHLLASDGPETDVLDHVREALAADGTLVDARRDWLLAAAESEARGLPAPSRVEEIPVIDATEVRDAVAGLLPSMLVTVPRHLVDDLDAFEHLEEELALEARVPWRSYADMSRREIMIDLAGGGARTGLASALVASTGTFHKGRFFGPQRGVEICLGPRQLVLVQMGVKVQVEDVVLMGDDDDGDIELVTRTGASVVINPRHFRRAARPWARFVAALPPDVVRSKRGADALSAVSGVD